MKKLASALALLMLLASAKLIHANLPPILLVPGIGGSMLRTEDGVAWIGLEDLIWSLVNYEADGSHFQDYTDNTFRKNIAGFYDGSGGIKPVFSNHSLTVPYSMNGKGPPGTYCEYNGKLGGLCGIEYLVDILDSAGDTYYSELIDDILHQSSADYFADLIEFFEIRGYVGGQNLFGFPYDWRKSVRYRETLSRLDETLRLASNNGQEKVSILSHSMGCLMVKAYFSLYPDNAAKYIGKWIAIAGPFQGGAGNAIEALFSGYALGHFEICHCSARQLTVQSPSALEILPTQWLEDNLSPVALLAQWQGGQIEVNGKEDILRVAELAYRNHSFTYEGRTVAWPFSQAAKEWADKTQAILQQRIALPSSVQMYVLYADGLSTPYNVSYQIQGPTGHPSDLLCNPSCQQNDCYTRANDCSVSYAFTDGDGTVPSLSASHPFGDEANEPQNLIKYAIHGLNHMGIIKDWNRVFPIIQQWLGSGAE